MAATPDDVESAHSGPGDREATPPCPRCGAALDERRIHAAPQVAYVRRRVWRICPSCGWSAVAERPAADGGEAPPTGGAS